MLFSSKDRPILYDFIFKKYCTFIIYSLWTENWHIRHLFVIIWRIKTDLIRVFCWTESPKRSSMFLLQMTHKCNGKNSDIINIFTFKNFWPLYGHLGFCINLFRVHNGAQWWNNRIPLPFQSIHYQFCGKQRPGTRHQTTAKHNSRHPGLSTGLKYGLFTSYMAFRQIRETFTLLTKQLCCVSAK